MDLLGDAARSRFRRQHRHQIPLQLIPQGVDFVVVAVAGAAQARKGRAHVPGLALAQLDRADQIELNVDLAIAVSPNQDWIQAPLGNVRSHPARAYRGRRSPTHFVSCREP